VPLKGEPVSLRTAFFPSTLLAAVMILSAVAYSRPENCPCPVRDSNDSQSLADVAKEAKKNKVALAKKSVIDDDIISNKGPFPRLNIQNTDNSDEVVEAIAKFKKHP